MNDTPELDKMLANKEQSQVIGEFLDYLFSVKKLSLMYYKPESIEYYDEDFQRECEGLGDFKAREHRWNNTGKWGYRCGWMRHNQDIETMLAEYFGVDLKKAEKEKQQILNDIRKQNAKT